MREGSESRKRPSHWDPCPRLQNQSTPRHRADPLTTAATDRTSSTRGLPPAHAAESARCICASICGPGLPLGTTARDLRASSIHSGSTSELRFPLAGQDGVTLARFRKAYTTSLSPPSMDLRPRDHIAAAQSFRSAMASKCSCICYCSWALAISLFQDQHEGTI